MIVCYTGTPGSGKSYHALLVGLEKIKSFRNNFVIANFPIKFKNKEVKKGISERWIYLDNDDLTVKRLVELSIKKGFYGKEGSCKVIIDEAGVFFNSRDWQIKGKERKDWIMFMSQSRKFGYDIILITQDLRMIDRQIRSLIEFETKHVNLRAYWWFAWLPFRVFATVTWWTGGRFKGSLGFVLFRKRIAKRYDTMKLFNIEEISQLISSDIMPVEDSLTKNAATAEIKLSENKEKNILKDGINEA